MREESGELARFWLVLLDRSKNKKEQLKKVASTERPYKIVDVEGGDEWGWFKWGGGRKKMKNAAGEERLNEQ